MFPCGVIVIACVSGILKHTTMSPPFPNVVSVVCALTHPATNKENNTVFTLTILPPSAHCAVLNRKVVHLIDTKHLFCLWTFVSVDLLLQKNDQLFFLVQEYLFCS